VAEGMKGEVEVEEKEEVGEEVEERSRLATDRGC